jgi:hypothetical protein
MRLVHSCFNSMVCCNKGVPVNGWNNAEPVQNARTVPDDAGYHGRSPNVIHNYYYGGRG